MKNHLHANLSGMDKLDLEMQVRLAEAAANDAIDELIELKTVHQFDPDDKTTWPEEGMHVIVTDPGNPFPYSVEQFVLLDKHLHETTDKKGTPVLEDGCFWMPLPITMLTYKDLGRSFERAFNVPSNAVASVQRDQLTHKDKPHE